MSSTTSSTPVMETPPGWDARERPPLLFRRFEFESYAATRSFLDRLEALSKEHEYFPDLSFAAKYVNVTIQARDEKALTPADYAFATRVSGLATIKT